MIKKLAKKLYGTNSVFRQPKYHGYWETGSANEIDTKEIIDDIFSDIDIFELYKIIVSTHKMWLFMCHYIICKIHIVLHKYSTHGG